MTTDRNDPGLTTYLDDGQQTKHMTLSDDELAKGFVRPLRETYMHEPCGAITTMGPKIAATYATDPTYYGSTFCKGCGSYYSVGADGEFVWLDDKTKVGT